MKRYLVLGLLTATSSIALAQEVKVEPSTQLKARIRLDALSQLKETKTTSTTKAKNSGFRLGKTDFTLINKLGDSKIQIRLAPIQSGWDLETATSNSGKGLPKFVEQFWLEHPLMEGLSLRAGKLDTILAGSYEHLVDTSFDYYITSYYKSTLIPSNPLGLDLSYKLDKNEIRFQVANGVPTDVDRTGAIDYSTDGGLSTSLAYLGDFGFVKPVASYTMVRYAEPKHTYEAGVTDHSHTGKGANLIGVGALVDAAGAAVSAEVNLGTIDPYDQVTVATGAKTATKKESLTNLIAQVKYPVGPVTPFLKLTVDEHKKNLTDKRNDVSQTAYSLGVSYGVSKGGRFDVVMNNTANEKVTSATAKTKATTTEYIFATALKI